MTDPRATSLKRFALRVAALAAADREWLYRQLPDGPRDQLDRLVNEAIALQLHRDPAVLESLALPETGAQASARSSIENLPAFWQAVLASLEPSPGGSETEAGNKRPRAPAMREYLIGWANSRHSGIADVEGTAA